MTSTTSSGTFAVSDVCPVYAPFFSALGCIASITLTSLGAAYGTAKSSSGTFAAATLHPALAVRVLIPTIFSGILAIYGLVCSVLIANHIVPKLTLYTALVNLGSGLSVGLCGLAAGFAIGIVGDAGCRGFAVQRRLYTSMVLILIFGEVLGLYGMIVALVIDQKARAAGPADCDAAFGMF